MIKKKDVFSGYRDLEQSYMQLNHYLQKFQKIRVKVAQQLSERTQSPGKNRKPDPLLENLFPQGVAGVHQEAERDLKKIVNLFKQLEARLQQLKSQPVSEITPDKTKR